MSRNYPIYSECPEFAIVYRSLYGQELKDSGFIERQQSSSGIAIATDLSAQNIANDPALKAALEREPDLPFRQLLWYLRPSATFLAFDSACLKWRDLHKALCQNDRSLMPWDGLLETTTRIERCITQFLLENPTDVKKQFPFFGIKTGLRPNANVSSKNPMVSRGSSAFPLYTLTLNDLELPSAHSSASAEGQKLKADYLRLTAFTIIRAAQRREFDETLATDETPHTREQRFLNPYGFLRENQAEAPDIGKLQQLDRTLRKPIDNALSIWTRLTLLLNGDFFTFCDQCRELADNPDSDLSFSHFIDFFAHKRRIRNHTTRGIKSTHHVNAGHHDWTPPAHLIFTEELPDGRLIDVIPLLVSGSTFLDPEELVETFGGDERPDIEVLLSYQDDRPHDFVLDQHTSHSQLLRGSLNQPLWWDRSNLSYSDIHRFLQYLDHRQADTASNPMAKTAGLLIRLNIQLGISIERLLQLEIVTIDNPDWLTGSSLFRLENDLKTTSEAPLRLAFIAGSDLPYWVLPLPIPANPTHANLPATDLYFGHTQYLPIADTAQLGQKLLKNDSALKALSMPVQCFTPEAKIAYRTHCEEIINAYGTIHPGFTTSALKNFWYGHLMRKGIPTRLLDLLIDKVPMGRSPRLHYASWPINHPIQCDTKTEPLSLPDAISFAMPLTPKQTFTATHICYDASVTIGATGLVRPERIRLLIQTLKERIAQSPAEVSDIDSLTATQTAFNAYSLYMALWFMIESSHRPHHSFYINWRDIDAYLHQVTLKDKSNAAGDKYRKSQLSRPLRLAMQAYETTQQVMMFKAQRQGFGVSGQGLRQMNVLLNNGQLEPIETLIDGFDAQTLRALLQQEFPDGIELNFHRRLIPYLMSLSRDEATPYGFDFASLPVEEVDIDLWLGHWQHGTAIYHRFGSGNVATALTRISSRQQEIVTQLGLTPLDFRAPRFDTKFLDLMRGFA